ncbi:hypothetical protein ACFVGN_29225 [Streptomyces sp. NPDC057757]|uniref:hypothetical protein n=1 Tax=Streptomyces sp. NPDC057757 TaxID=3346241 RepID=UPI0036BB3D3D
MEMNDTFAATVAAVVPVLWLVAAVEMHQYRRRMQQVAGFADQLLTDAVTAVRSAPAGGESVEVTTLAKTALNTEAPKETSRTAYDLYFYYQLTAAQMIATEGFALAWLLGWHDDPKITGWVMLAATMAGFVAVLALPIRAVKAEAKMEERRRELRREALRDFLRGQENE